MSAETVLENVLLEIGLDRLSPQLSSAEFEIRQVLRYMNAAGKEISTRTEWSRLYKQMTVSGGKNSEPLPADFRRVPEKGAVRLNKAAFTPVRAVVDPETWQFLSARPSATHYYHLSGGNILFSPTLDADGAIVPYVSTYWVEEKDKITQNGDNLLIPERLVEKGAVWRWKRQAGLPYDDILAEFEADLVADIKADRGEG